jgi:PhnB protein
MGSLTWHVVVGDPDRASSWYTSVLGAEETSRIVLASGQALTVELRFGDTAMALGAESPRWGSSRRRRWAALTAMHLAVKDADMVWNRAVGAGAVPFEPLCDAFWGERTGQFIDPFGHRWAVDQHLRDVPHDEVVRLAAEAFSTEVQG